MAGADYTALILPSIIIPLLLLHVHSCKQLAECSALTLDVLVFCLLMAPCTIELTSH